ncbi:MAG: VOC family protein [Gemmatimonadota bacterium]|nr:VOC family protein [Gemmatimonadota bacterium]
MSTRARRPHRALRATGGLLAAALTVSGCASGGGAEPAAIPPLASPPTNEIEPGRFVWYDLVTEDVDAARRFYGALFGWEFTEVDGDRLHIVTVNGRDIASIIDLEDTVQEIEGAAWFSSVSVLDVDAAAAEASRGGTLNVQPTDAPNRGRYSVIEDPHGALLVLLRATGGDPVEHDEIGSGEFLWTELWTSDAREAVSWYESLLDYESDFTGDDRRQYWLMSRAGEPRAGIGQLPFEADPAWLPYVAVADAEGTVDRVVELGGEVLIRPEATVRGSTAVIVDPNGGILAVQEWPLPDEGSDDETRGGSR